MTSDEAHLSIDQLADLGADAMPAAEMVAAHAHLGACVDCRATSDLLAGLPTLLASVEAPPMPPEVTARVVAAIEREQISRAGEASARDTAPTRPERVGLRRRFGARLGAGLLGATAVLGGGYLVISSLGGDGDDAPTSAQVESAEDAGGTGTLGASSPGTAYSAISLDEEVLVLLAQRQVAATDIPDTERTPAEPGLPSTNQSGGPDGQTTSACVAATQRKAGSRAVPLAVDVSTYEGAPAVVIVLPGGPKGAATVTYDVWVVGSGCVGADSTDIDPLVAGLDVLKHKSVVP